MATSNFGIDFPTGKLSLPFTLGTLTGPAGFGESVDLLYATTGLLKQAQTWNEEAPTSTVGLGWTLITPYIMRAGMGSWQDSFYLVMGESTLPLMLRQSPPLPFNQSQYDTNPSYKQKWDQLEFATQAKSLLQITYDRPSETWTIRDGSGVTSIYGGAGTKAVDLGVRWTAMTDNQISVWVGSSTESESSETGGQENYAIAWRLASKTTLSGQKVTYTYIQAQQNVGLDGTGLPYTSASYLKKVAVKNGASVTLTYKKKNKWEHPQFHTDNSSAPLVSNAFQDRIETQFLKELVFQDVNKITQKKVILNYKFLYGEKDDPEPSFNLGDLPHKNGAVDWDSVNTMNKRLLVSIETLTPEGVAMMPALEFDYWGLYDKQLQNKIGQDKKKFKAVSSEKLSKENIKPGPTPSTYTGPTYNALFGHLKNIKSPEGSLTWYSYINNSQKESNWELTLESSKITPPTVQVNGQSLNWKDPRPYWGNDNYVILRWNAKDSSNDHWVYLEIYEWVGKWVKVPCYNLNAPGTPEDSMIFLVKKPQDYYIRISTGVGKFAFVRTRLPASDIEPNKGTVALFHRDSNIPGQWNSTYYTPETYTGNGNIHVVPKHGDNNKPEDYPYAQLDLEVGDSIVGFLDKVSGKLHLYSLANNRWNQYQSNAGITITPVSALISKPSFDSINYTSGLSINGNDAFILDNETIYDGSDFPVNAVASYQLWHYDVTADNVSATWNNVIPKTQWNQNPVSGINTGGTYVIGISISPAEGFILAQIVVEFNPFQPIGTTYISRPVVISWDEHYNDINLQRIYSPNNAGTYAPGEKLFWGDVLEKTRAFGDASGIITSSNLINISTGEGSTDKKNKYVTRYIAGDNVDDLGKNTGWNCNSTLGDLEDNSELWEQMASLDTTVGISEKKGFKYRCNFYQFNPYTSDASINTAGWSFQDKVDMGKRTDWKRVEQIIDEVIFIVSNALAVLSLPLSFGASGAFWEVISFLDFVVNGPQSFAYGAIESAVFSKLLRNNRVGDTSLGLNYILVGAQGLNNGQPSVYFKKWIEGTSTTPAHWEWDTADEYGMIPPLADNLLENAVPYPIFYSSYNQYYNGVAFDVYRYGSFFIPIPYRVNLHRGVPGTDYRRDVYLDQLVFFRNGVLSKISTMPTFTTNSTKDPNHINSAYSPIDTLPYSLYQDPNASQSSLFASWGGLLAYEPQVYTDFLEETNNNNYIIIEGETGSDWPSTSFSFSGSKPGSDDYPPQPTIGKSLGLKFFMARDEKADGLLADYVIDKVSVDDGYQVFDTHIRYMPEAAIYQPTLNAVSYNQIRITSGASGYNEAIKVNGWIEQYFYNGMSSSLNNNNLLPYDPATDTSNPFYSQGLFYTNSQIMPNLLFEQNYAQRVLKHTNTDPNGIESSRQYIYYMAYNQSLIAPFQTTISRPQSPVIPSIPQQTAGYVQTLSVNLNAPDNTNDIQIQNGPYVLTTMNSYFDLFTLQGQNDASGFETALPLSQKSLSYHYTSPQSDPSDQYIENRTTYAFIRKEYKNEFTKPDIWLWNPVALTATYQTRGSSNIVEPIAATSTTYNSAFTAQGQKYWYPFGSYRWIGTGFSAPLNLNHVPWAATQESQLPPQGTDWQLSSFTRDIKDGIIHNAVSVQAITTTPTTQFQGPRLTQLYDTSKNLLIGEVTSPNFITNSSSDIDESMVRFCSFELYEDLTNWAIFANNQFNPINAAIYTTKLSCYAGTQSLYLTPQYGTLCWGSADHQNHSPADELALSLFYAQNQDAAQSPALRVWLFAEQNGVTTNLVGPAQPFKTFSPQGPANVWKNEQILIPLKDLAIQQGLTPPYKLWVGFDAAGIVDYSKAIYLDAISLTPLEASGQFHIYNQSTRLPIATIDINGTTTRFAYDSHRRVIGMAQGRGLTQEIFQVSLLSYSREKPNSDNFNSEYPNMKATLPTATGGQYFDFRTAGDSMGWYAEPGTVQVANNQLILGSNTTSLHSAISPCKTSIGIRAQVRASVASGTRISIALQASGTVTIQWEFGVGFTLTAPTGTTTYPYENLPQDWLLLAFPETVYFYADGQIVASVDISSFPISFESVVPILSTALQASFQEIMFMKDPRFSASFLDGSGKARQTQMLAEVA